MHKSDRAKNVALAFTSPSYDSRTISRGFLSSRKAMNSRVPKVVVARPFEKFKLAYEHGLQPHTFFHLLSRKSLPPTPAPRFGEIPKGTLADFQSLEMLEQPLS